MMVKDNRQNLGPNGSPVKGMGLTSHCESKDCVARARR